MKPDPNDWRTWIKKVTPLDEALDNMPEWQKDATIELIYDLKVAAAEGWSFCFGEA